MSFRHRAPDGGICNWIKGGQHGLVRTFGSVSWEGTGPTCPTPGSPGHFTCFKCRRTNMPGSTADAQRHASSCQES